MTSWLPAALGRSVVVIALALIAFPSAIAAGSTGIPVAPGVYLKQASAGGAAEPRSIRRESRGRSAQRIVGGAPTSIDQMPWQVAVAYAPGVRPGDGYDRQFCGGSLVSPTLVITAAHCVHDDETGFLPSGAFSVISGRTNLSSNAGRESLLDTYYIFTDAQGQPLYNSQTIAWDVVLFELADSALGSPIEIAGVDEAELWSLGRAAYVSGWGTTSEKGDYFPDGLLSAEITVLRDQPCAAAVGTLGIRFDTATSLCAGTALGDHDTCYGDSGGPMVVPMGDGSVRLVGDTSYGAECASIRGGVYGRLAADPMRSALRNAALSVTGQDIVGFGGQAPTTLTPTQARENAWIYVEDDCNQWRPCRSYGAKRCSVSGLGFRCSVNETAKNRRYGRFRCKRKVFVSAASGSIERRGLRRWKCR